MPSLEQQANMRTLVKAGWRIYDVRGKNILDEDAVARTITYHGRGTNPLLAAGALIDRKEAVKEVGNMAGRAYACSIIPLWQRVTRDYYVGVMVISSLLHERHVRVTGMTQLELWLKRNKKNAKGKKKKKIAGRACCNMAIISEINGEVDMAIKWAQTIIRKL